MIEGTCKLCLRVTPLLDSHYLPKRLYSMNMERSLKNPNPVTLAHGQAKQVSDQLHGYTFCATCENLFNKYGEKWVLDRVAKGYRESSALQEALIPEFPYYGNESLNAYAGRSIPAFDLERLIYFGTSVFWRGASRTWNSSTGALAPPVDLGAYFEPIRQFLLGGLFPESVYMVVLVHNHKPVPNATIPVQKATNQYGDFYWFYANGLGFELYLGESVPEAIKSVCAFHNPRGPIIVDRGFGQMVHDFLRGQLDSSKQSESVVKLVLDRRQSVSEEAVSSKALQRQRNHES